MKKTVIILLIAATFAACEKKLSICECMDLKASLTDSMTLSKDELEEKRKGCEWVERELSPLEITQKFLECNGVQNSNNENTNSNVTEVESDKIEQENNEETTENANNEKENKTPYTIPQNGTAYCKELTILRASPNYEDEANPYTVLYKGDKVSYSYNIQQPDWIFVKFQFVNGDIAEGWMPIKNFETFEEVVEPIADPGFF